MDKSHRRNWLIRIVLLGIFLMINQSLDQALHDTFHGSRKSPKAISEECGVKYNYMARMVLNGESGCNFPVHLLIPFMQSAKNYSVLKVLANSCGFLLVKRPRCASSRKSQERSLRGWQSGFARMMESVIRFIDEPSGKRQSEALDGITAHLEESELWRRSIHSGDVKQLELF